MTKQAYKGYHSHYNSCMVATAQMQCHTCSTTDCTLELNVYYLESASLKLKSLSTLGLQQNFYEAIKIIIMYKAFHHSKYLPLWVYSCFSKPQACFVFAHA